MEIIVEGDKAWTKTNKNLERRGFGVKKGDKLILDPVEVVYFFIKNNAEVRDRRRKYDINDVFEWAKEKRRDFLCHYFVYEDLRGRGYRVKLSNDFLIGKYVFYPVSERVKIKIPELNKLLRNFGEIVLAIVDEESEITYYKVYQIDFFGEQEEKLEKIRGYFVEDRVVTQNIEVFTKFFYGSKKNEIVSLSLIESLYLAENGWLEGVEFKDLYRLIKDNLRKYEVYKDLKRRKFVVKTGFKFGSDFRVYDKVESIEDLPHSKYLVSVVDDREISMSEIVRAVRLAHNVRKKMVFAFNDGIEKYLVIERVKV
ncbi:tRNA-intron lyase [Archaeoglobales archaeon]|nr:MAG: tRNA-intron lyase [Archaeoglobales archaeon]